MTPAPRLHLTLHLINGMTRMKVSDLDSRLWFGDVIICKIDTNIFTGEPLKSVGYSEMIVTWIRNEDTDGPRDLDGPNDFDVILMDINGEVSHITDVKSLDDWEYSHCAFQRGAWQEEER